MKTRPLSPRRSPSMHRNAAAPRAGRLLLGIVLGLSLAACPDEPDPCVGTETVHVKMTGNCAPGVPEFDVVRTGCRLTLNTSGSVGELPLVGVIDDERHVVRGGGWQVFGCSGGQQSCDQDGFRRCVTRRVDWQLDLTCLDGRGAPVCHATLTE